MSVQELLLIDSIGNEIEIKFKDNEFELKLPYETPYVWLNRNQAHLLKLWLEEHLK